MVTKYGKHKLVCLFIVLFLASYEIYMIKDIVQVVRFYAWYYISGEKFGNIYMLSAVAKLGISKTGYTHVVLNVWDNSINKNFYCCFQFDNYFSIVKAVRTNRFDFNTPNLASQYECDISSQRALPWKVGVTELESCNEEISLKHEIRNKQKCYEELCKNTKKYYDIHYPKKNEGKLGLCPKIAYDKIHPIKLIEWFEYQKIMGVTKVIISVQYLNTDALRVLEHYKEEGLAEIVLYPSEIPGDVYGLKNRGFEVERRVFPQFSHDEQIAVYHCFSRLQGFEYASVIDFDEYLVSPKNQTTLELIKELTYLYPKAAGFTFYTSFYLTDNVDTYSGVLTSSYVMKVGPRMECQKNAYIPDRVITASTHYVVPSENYDIQIVPPEIAVLNHYRNCPGQKHWKNNCRGVHQTKDTTMLRYSDQLSNRIQKVKRIIN